MITPITPSPTHMGTLSIKTKLSFFANFFIEVFFEDIFEVETPGDGLMDKIAQQNAENAKESASASEELTAQTVQMKEVVAALAKLVEGTGERDSRKESAPSTEKGPDELKETGPSKQMALSHLREVGPDKVIPFLRL